MDKTYRINLDVGSKEPQQTNIVVCQGDSGIRFEIEVTGIDTTGIPARIVFKNQKGESYETEQFTKTGTRYVYILLGNEISHPGTVVADVKLIESTKRISSTKFLFTVDQDTLNDSPIQSGAYSSRLNDAINRTISAAENAENVVAGLFPIANNLTTEVAGYALDARMGKELQRQITVQNDNLAMQSIAFPGVPGVADSTGSSYVRKSGKVVTINLRLEATLALSANSQTLVGTLPVGYRPITPQYPFGFNYNSPSSITICAGTIGIDGTVKIMPTVVGATNIFHINFSFLCA